jgi:hypothetical protein
MRKIALFAVALSGCTPVTPLPGLPAGECSTTELGNLVGRQATSSLVERAKRRAGASVARILRPGQVVTMEYRSGRLNVNVDGRNRVQRFTCG